MGHSSSKSHVLGHTSAPPYCIKRIGGNHVLVAGGGGSAKTGVRNTMDVYLIELNDGQNTDQHVKLVKVQSFDTGPAATMNLDLKAFNANAREFVLAAGQDDKCSVYRLHYDTNYLIDGQLIANVFQGRSTSNDHSNPRPALPPNLSMCRKSTIAVEPVKSFVTDFSANQKSSAFQKVCRVDPSDKRAFIATGGSDGHIRMWNPRTGERLRQMKGHQGDVDDLDIAGNGSMLISVGHDGQTVLWRTGDGAELTKLPLAPELANATVKWRNRCVRFTNLGVMNQVFVTATVPVQRAARGQQSYLCLWAYNMQNNQCRSIVARVACNEIISALCVSACGDFTAVGTLQGSVGIYDTHTMRNLRYFREKHDIFVTGVEFLALDTAAATGGPVKSTSQQQQPQQQQPPLFSPIGQCCDAAVLSISADQSVQLHCLPAQHLSDRTATGTLVGMLLWALLIYTLLSWLKL